MQVISGVNNSAFFAQSAYSASTASYDVNGYPITSYLPESGVGYNAVNEISALNGSAIAQYGHEAQWLQHDDTIVHVSNSAQYALGVNLSAVQTLMGQDETLLWSGTWNTSANTIELSEPASAFDKVRIIGGSPYYIIREYGGDATMWSWLQPYCNDTGTIFWAARYNISATDGKTVYYGNCGRSRITTAGVVNFESYNITVGELQISKVVGIGRKS